MTATALSSSENPVISGQPLTLTARVGSPSGGTPTGTVRFIVNVQIPSRLVPLVNGTASYNTFASEVSDLVRLKLSVT